ncbi:hypothetical protein ES702_01949 [subsurface metagenome]
MKVLHIWSCAGISSLIAKYMDLRHGTESDVILTEKWDHLGLNDYRTMRMKSKPLFGLKALIMARKYDLIHVHYHSIFIPYLKFQYNKPVIIHFHGSDVRENWTARLGRIKRADAILISTKDLLQGAPPNAIWIPNPVDTVKFTPISWIPKKNSALTFSYEADEEAQSIAEYHDLDLDIIKEKIPHGQVPKLMSKYRFYIEVKRDFKGRLLYDGSILSKSGLEALAMGLKVISRNMSVREGLPEIHRPENVADRVFSLYEELLREK